MRFGEYIGEAWERDRKTVECVGLFCFLVVTYGIYLAIQLRVLQTALDPGDSLLGPLAKLCLISALPFAVLAYSDNDWCSEDAAPVCLAAWIAVCVGFWLRCPICVVSLAVTFFPFILSTLLAHGFGTLCRFFKRSAH